MLRTIIEHHDHEAHWQPAFPLWFGEPTDPMFAFDVAANLVPALIASGATVVTDHLPEYRQEELNVDGTADWYYADIQQLLDGPVIKGRRALEMMLRCLKDMSVENGCELEHLRVVFYKPLMLDIR